ncbi:hypothetical protein Hrd1104_01430 [Halorhabdus sp. CBA1104]|uniref:hypothetical protein n=1 Tax=unclassified Halorhabdus TaxID=2621901 RepID=UPI0012B2721E|nr:MULTISPECIES: hypothetical protein [unclassified Halorhabdus]QGN06085.1 hypothetical protein Hrd1104_01430 [Halorhabdus sp. CBA1104]
MPGAGEAPSDRLRDRASGSDSKLWLFMGADRWLVTGLLVAVVFVTLTAAGSLLPAAEVAIRSGDSVDTLFQALLTATITGVTLVLTLNQLVLSQELGAAGDQRERMEEAMAFREDVADAVGTPVSPARPAQFLRALVQVSGERARDLRDAVSTDADASTSDTELQEAVEDFTDSLIANSETVATGLDDARFGEFDVIASALDFNYSWKIFTARRIHERYGDALDTEGQAALDQLIDTLELFGPAREHFKTLYFQWDLIDLSRRILVASVPALLVSATMVAFFDASTHTPAVAGVDMLVPIVAAATTVALIPFLLLLAYIVRIATVTKHTLSIGPFILRETDDVAEVEWDQ